jgi:hypothetical protein
VQPRLYSELPPQYRVVDPPADHLEEATTYEQALIGAVTGPAETLFERGAGAGHNACHLKRRFRCTLSDLSPEMQALRREPWRRVLRSCGFEVET